MIVENWLGVVFIFVGHIIDEMRTPTWEVRLYFLSELVTPAPASAEHKQDNAFDVILGRITNAKNAASAYVTLKRAEIASTSIGIAIMQKVRIDLQL